MLGAALIFWGLMTEHPFIAIGLALLVEGARWMRLRWDFDDSAYIRAWQISVISSAATAASRRATSISSSACS